MSVFLKGFVQALGFLVVVVVLVLIVVGFVFVGNYLGGVIGKWIAIALVGCVVYGVCCWLDEKENYES